MSSTVTQDTTVSNDTAAKTYTLKEITQQCMDFCGGEVGGLLEAKIGRWINAVLGEMLTDIKAEWMLAQSGFETIAEYNTGTATFTKGSTTVTFSGSTIVAGMVGRKIVRDGDTTGYVIDSRTSATELEIADSYMEGTVSGVSFHILEDTYSLDTNFDAPLIIDQMFSNIHLQIVDHLSPKFEIGEFPKICKITLDKLIVLKPAPTRLIKINYEFYRDFSKLSTATATIHLPDKYVSVLCFGVARNYWLAMGQGRESSRKSEMFAQMFEKGKVEIRADKYNDDGRLVQFIPYKQPGIVDLGDNDLGQFSPEGLIG